MIEIIEKKSVSLGIGLAQEMSCIYDIVQCFCSNMKWEMWPEHISSYYYLKFFNVSAHF